MKKPGAKFNLSIRAISVALCFALVFGIITGCEKTLKGSTYKVPEISDEISTDNSGFLNITSPTAQNFETHSEKIIFNGSCNKIFSLTVNGKEEKIDKNGFFEFSKKLKLGENTFILKNGKSQKDYTVIYTLPMIKSCTPEKQELILESNARFTVTAYAFIGSSVKAEISNKSVQLIPDTTGVYDRKTYTRFSGVIELPKKNIKTDGDELVFTATYADEKFSVTSAKIKIITPEQAADQNPTPLLDMSTDKNGFAKVEEGYIARILSPMAETFNGGIIDDISRPTNNYLPYGTLDQCSPTTLYDSESGKKYYLLKSNQRIYADDENVKIYRGTLPDQNTIKFVNEFDEGNRYKFTLYTEWRAPFSVSYGNQGYNNPSVQDYNITSPTFTYIDINFTYCAKIDGKLNLYNNPIFKYYEVIKTKTGTTLRLHLKKAGVFYGWDARYKDSNSLEFSFLKPAKITPTHKNKYGYSLQGIKILIDPGHGGEESGTYNAFGSSAHEKEYNLAYAMELAIALKRIGATVTLTRIKDQTVSLQNRYNCIRKSNANMVVSVHFNGSGQSTHSGYFMGYFYPFTYTAAKTINQSVKATGLLNPLGNGQKWHYFNLSRCAFCPVVLTENGYLTNPKDYEKIKSDEHRKEYVDGIVCGIVNYFIWQSRQ